MHLQISTEILVPGEAGSEAIFDHPPLRNRQCIALDSLRRQRVHGAPVRSAISSFWFWIGVIITEMSVRLLSGAKPKLIPNYVNPTPNTIFIVKPRRVPQVPEGSRKTCSYCHSVAWSLGRATDRKTSDVSEFVNERGISRDDGLACSAEHVAIAHITAMVRVRCVRGR
jgi:hypothetical protein